MIKLAVPFFLHVGAEKDAPCRTELREGDQSVADVTVVPVTRHVISRQRIPGPSLGTFLFSKTSIGFGYFAGSLLLMVQEFIHL